MSHKNFDLVPDKIVNLYDKASKIFGLRLSEIDGEISEGLILPIRLTELEEEKVSIADLKTRIHSQARILSSLVANQKAQSAWSVQHNNVEELKKSILLKAELDPESELAKEIERLKSLRKTYSEKITLLSAQEIADQELILLVHSAVEKLE